jgi:hypothetical protein
MVHLDDIKVLGANTLCMAILAINSINTNLQSILFLATIGYTIVRTANEIQQFKNKRKEKQDDDSAGN